MARSGSSMFLIQKIVRLAVQKFSRDPHKSQDFIGTELDQIRNLVNCVTTSDLNIDAALLEDRGVHNPESGIAPVTYMEIYEDADVTICIFILKNGVRLPLHDHPDMNGLLKVIHGSISVQSYTLNCNSQIISNTKPFPGIYPAVKHPCTEITSNDPACPLDPNSHNLHDITSVGGLAAFLDILSPPYGLDRRNGEERECHYYEEMEVRLHENSEENSVYLMKIPTPTEFWCDKADYKGPSVLDSVSVINGQNDS